uniref:rRNA biogenesis protein RRP36 n=1 Tax=Steinernema glaseri TaxID=37863 RepID=A0A1I7YCJ8_9BILA
MDEAKSDEEPASTPEQRAIWARRSRERYNAMTPAERAQRNRRSRLPAYMKSCSEQEAQEYLDALKRQKAEKQRMRYHSMTPEQRRAYNQRRTELYKQKRAVQKKLLQTRLKEATKADIAELTNLLEQRKKRAETARKRYHRLSVAEKQKHNKRRTRYSSR